MEYVREVVGKMNDFWSEIVADGTYKIKTRNENIKSKLVLGNFTIYFEKHFNWFNRLMLRLVFGLNIEKVNLDE